MTELLAAAQEVCNWLDQSLNSSGWPRAGTRTTASAGCRAIQRPRMPFSTSLAINVPMGA